MARRSGRHSAWESRVCRRCSESYLLELTGSCMVDDEYHLVFECQAVSDIRSQLEQQWPNLLKAATTVRQFLEGDFRPTYQFISDCMKRIDEGVQPPLQAEQPNRAEGQM